MNGKTPKLHLDVVIDRGNEHSDLVEPSARKPARARVKVAGVYVMGDRASAVQLKQSVAVSFDMLRRLAQKIARPGVRLNTPRDIPLYFSDPNHQGRFLRKLNGKTESGVLDNGAFKVLD